MYLSSKDFFKCVHISQTDLLQIKDGETEFTEIVTVLWRLSKTKIDIFSASG